MPRNSQHLAIARQWEILKILPARPPGLAVSDLAERLRERGFEISARTLQRDLVELSRLFPLKCNDRSKPFGWHWARRPDFHLPGLELADAVSLALIEQSLKPVVPVSLLRVLRPKFNEARSKLKAAADNRYSRWTERVRYMSPGLQLQPPRVVPAVLETVQEALMESRQIEVRYLRIDASKAKALTLHPLALIQLGPTGYLVASAFDHNEPLKFALHRIQSAKPTREPARRPPGFSVDGFIAEGGMQFGGGEAVRLTADVDKDLAMHLTETPLSDDQKIDTRRTPWRLTATVRESWQLTFWILSQGERFVVVKPKALRKELHAALTDALEAYGTV